jgi:hypothetical protein
VTEPSGFWDNTGKPWLLYSTFPGLFSQLVEGAGNNLVKINIPAELEKSKDAQKSIFGKIGKHFSENRKTTISGLTCAVGELKKEMYIGVDLV